jgi:2-haloacid dehalogenase
MALGLDDVKILSFDTGGTILDRHSGISAALAETGRRHGVTHDWPALTNEYRRRALRRIVNQVDPPFNFDDVHRELVDELIDEAKITAFTAEDRAGIAARWHQLDCWPDFVPGFERLKQRYTCVSFTLLSLALVIAVSRRNGINWDAVISCEMLRVYKTKPEAYQRVAKLVQAAPSDILMVACHISTSTPHAASASAPPLSAGRTNGAPPDHPTPPRTRLAMLLCTRRPPRRLSREASRRRASCNTVRAGSVNHRWARRRW